MPNPDPPLQPIEIPNVNLERVEGGLPGFITVSRHMCVGDFGSGGTTPTGGLDETKLLNISTSIEDYRYACGYYHNLHTYQAINPVGAGSFEDTYNPNNVADGTTNRMWSCANRKACSDCSPACGIHFGGDTAVEFIERATNLRKNVFFRNRIPLIPRAFIQPTLNEQNRLQSNLRVESAVIFKHPRMAIDELKYFGINDVDRNKIRSVSAGEKVLLEEMTCIGGQKTSLAVAIFKGDLTHLVAGDRSIEQDGKKYYLYKTLSKVSGDNQMHPPDELSYYTIHLGYNNNGGNEGNEGGGFTNGGGCPGIEIQIPEAPLWDDDSVMVVIFGNNTHGCRKNCGDSESRHLKRYTGSPGGETSSNYMHWLNGPHRHNTFWEPRCYYGEDDIGDRHHDNKYRTLGAATNTGCKIKYKIEKFTETYFGCSQLRDVEWKLTSSGNGQGGDQLWNVPESGSHIMKIVPSDYYLRECTDRISGLVDNDQDFVIYAANCKDDIGDPKDNKDPVDWNKNPDGSIRYPNADSGLQVNVKRTKQGKHFTEKCMSYSMNVNPEDTRSNQHRCCSPKISGPFLLETRRSGLGERFTDVPYVKDNPFGTRPDLSVFNDNFRYQLKNRMECECTASTCTIGPCYGCPTDNLTRYKRCLQNETCVENNCCVDPCVYGSGTPCPKNYDQCVNIPECNVKGCCSVCDDCNLYTDDDYNQCLAGTGKFSNTECNVRGCCKYPCYICPTDYASCVANSKCATNGCCVKECSDCDSSSMYETFSCMRNENIFGVTKYVDLLEGFCCQDQNPDPPADGSDNVTQCCGMPLSFNTSTNEYIDLCFELYVDKNWNGCINTLACKEAGCHLLRDNPRYDPNANTLGSIETSDSGGWAPLLKNFKMTTLTLGEPNGTCSGTCQDLMIRSPSITNEDLTTYFGIDVSAAANVPVAPPVGTPIRFYQPGCVGVDVIFKWGWTKWKKGRTTYGPVTELTTFDDSASDGRQNYCYGKDRTDLPQLIINMPQLAADEVLMIVFFDNNGSHTINGTFEFTNSSGQLVKRTYDGLRSSVQSDPGAGPRSSIGIVGNTCSSACPTATVSEYLDCLLNPICSGGEKPYTTNNKCCNFPCNENSTCFTQLNQIVPGTGRLISDYAECLDRAPACRNNGCCEFIFEPGCGI